MKPLRVALIHRDSRRCTDKRMVGIWSYPVPQFDVTHFTVDRDFQLDKADFASEYDLIFYEDGKLRGTFIGAPEIPICYYIVDSTLTEDHYRVRREQAAQVDLILVDHDDLQRFRWRDGPRVRRLNHCVNDKWFKDYGLEKTVDVSFHCRTSGSDDRAKLEKWLQEFCELEGHSYECGTKYDEEYAKAFNHSKLTVNLARTGTNRPHRVFDAMGCNTCLVTSRLPYVSGDVVEPRKHYVEWEGTAQLGGMIGWLLESGEWSKYAAAGYGVVHHYHTWAARAAELRQMLGEELGI